MSRADFRLANSAERDLEKIWRYSIERWSEHQAEAYIQDLFRIFGLIAENPGMGRESRELKPAGRVHVYRSHIIFYRVQVERVLIVRIIDGRQKWREILGLATD